MNYHPIKILLPNYSIFCPSSKETYKIVSPLFDLIVEKFPGPLAIDDHATQFLITNIDYDSYVGQVAVGRLGNGILEVNKRYSLCGIRVGCIISKNKDLMATALKFAQARLSPPTFGQVAGEAALSTPQSYFDEVSTEYIQRRDLLIEGLNKIEGVICPKPKGAFYCIAQLPVDNADKFAQWLLEEFDHEGKTLMVAPAAGFYSTPNTGTNQVRIAYVLKQEALTQAIVCLEKALEVYPGRIG